MESYASSAAGYCKPSPKKKFPSAPPPARSSCPAPTPPRHQPKTKARRSLHRHLHFLSSSSQRVCFILCRCLFSSAPEQLSFRGRAFSPFGCSPTPQLSWAFSAMKTPLHNSFGNPSNRENALAAPKRRSPSGTTAEKESPQEDDHKQKAESRSSPPCHSTKSTASPSHPA